MTIAGFHRRGQRGYSLAEMLVVVALIGLFSLVSVPQFINLYRQAKMRAAVRQFTGDLRLARARAITKNKRCALSFAPGATPAGGALPGQYAIYDQDGSSWTMVGNYRRLEQPIYFLASDFETDNAISDTWPDVVFKPDGTILNFADSGAAKIELKNNADLPNNHCTISMKIAGTFTSALSKD